jgi:very-short-patch-repair endonuclease
LLNAAFFVLSSAFVSYSQESANVTKVEEFLKEINLLDDFKFQEQIEYFTLDFGDKKRKIGIECQGTFFHVDPRFYPDGAIYPIQKRNLSRDTSKRNFFKKLKWTIIELWETEINNGSFKEILMSKLLELGVPEA